MFWLRNRKCQQPPPDETHQGAKIVVNALMVGVHKNCCKHLNTAKACMNKLGFTRKKRPQNALESLLQSVDCLYW